MQEYLHRSRFSQAMDALGLHGLLLLASIGWFVLLWGLRSSALLAGGALYGMLALLFQKGRDSRLKRREQRLRRQIGGEMAVERLLLTAPEKAHFEAAMLLSLRAPLTMVRMESEGVLCRLSGKETLVSFVQRPVKEALGAGDVLRYQRAARMLGADQALLCLSCPVSDAAREQSQAEPRAYLISRERMIALFGAQYPATNDQLVALGRRKRRKAPMKRWLRRILDRGKARRYALYGCLLLGFYLATGMAYYALPGLVCVTLATICHCGGKEEEPV